MTDANKTVFISYRRSVSRYIARSIFQHLHYNGYDAFLDVESIDSGQFETIILNQVAARAHFLVILTQGTLERCAEPGDWLRREIEFAIDLKRNVVPVLVQSFAFDEAAKKHLTGKLSVLPSYNALTLPYDYFEEAMARLCNRFLKEPVYSPIMPTPIEEEAKVEEMIDEVASASTPTKEELSAETLFSSGLSKQLSGDLVGAIADYTEAIRINPNYVEAYNNRGVARRKQGDVAGAIADYEEVIRIQPDYADAYTNRGVARRKQGDVAGAIADYEEAIRIKPDYVNAYNNRGNARYEQGDKAGAIADYTEAIRIRPDFAAAHNNRGNARKTQGDVAGAIADYEEAIHIKPDYAPAYNNRGEVYFAVGDCSKALADFQKADELRSDYPMTLGGLAITYHALGNYELAKYLWKSLLKRDERYRDVARVQRKFNWHESLVEEARKLIARLD